MCPKKQRWTQRDERYVQIAFACWLLFMDTMVMKKKNGYKYEDFIESSLYTGFIKHSRNAMLLHVLDVNDFTNFCISAGYKLQDWTKKHCYESYMKHLTVKETPERAITRSMKIMERWAEDNNGDVIGVEPPKGKEVQKLDECELFEKGLDNINKLSATLVVSKRGNSPCCIKCGRTYYCWC